MTSAPTRRISPLARISLVVLVASGAGLAGCGGGGETASRDDETKKPATATATESTPAADDGAAVAIKGFLFKPNPLEVEAGTEVTWTNQDQILHTATSGTPDARTTAFNLSFPERGATGAFTFDEPGTYQYFCDRHNSMTGTVVVS